MRWLLALVAAAAAACSPTIDCNALPLEACRVEARRVIEQAERHRPGVGVRHVDPGRDGAWMVEYADGSGMGATQ